MEQLKLKAEKENTSVNQILKSLAEKYVKGEIIDAGSALEGDPSTACIFKIERVKDCPIRLEIAELKKPKNAILLLKFCARCPYLKGEIQKRPAAAAQPGVGSPIAPLQPSSKDRRWFMCKNGCGYELFWHNEGTESKPKWLPYERDPMNVDFAIQHFCPGAKHGLPPQRHEGKKALPDLTARCTQCDFSIALNYFAESSDPLNDNRDTMIIHVKRQHDRLYLEPQEDMKSLMTVAGVKL